MGAPPAQTFDSERTDGGGAARPRPDGTLGGDGAAAAGTAAHRLREGRGLFSVVETHSSASWEARPTVGMASGC